MPRRRDTSARSTFWAIWSALSRRIRPVLGEIRMLKICLAVSLACPGASVPDIGFVRLAFWRFLVGIAIAVTMPLRIDWAGHPVSPDSETGKSASLR